jgi:NCS2 family nucleobase:cation symporter-2
MLVSAVVIGWSPVTSFALPAGMVTFEDRCSWNRAAVFEAPMPFKYGFELSAAAVIGFV